MWSYPQKHNIIMLISKHHLLARHTASKDDTRPLLCTVNITKADDEVIAVATDGYVLSEVRETVPADQEFPVEAVGVDHVRIEAKSAAKLASVMKPNRLIPVLGYANVTTEGVVVTDIERTYTFTSAEVEGKFPDYLKLIPATESAVARVRVDPEKLIQVLKAFKGEHGVDLELHGLLSPVVLRATNSERTITGVVMPLKS